MNLNENSSLKNRVKNAKANKSRNNAYSTCYNYHSIANPCRSKHKHANRRKFNTK